MKDEKAWRRTPKGEATYRAAKIAAQAQANGDGFDRGVAFNDLFHTCRVFLLPRKQNRCGDELRCEVVHCDDLSRCQPGHGPCA